MKFSRVYKATFKTFMNMNMKESKMNNLQFFDYVFSDYFKYVFEKIETEKTKLKQLSNDTERCKNRHYTN